MLQMADYSLYLDVVERREGEQALVALLRALILSVREGSTLTASSASQSFYLPMPSHCGQDFSVGVCPSQVHTAGRETIQKAYVNDMVGSQTHGAASCFTVSATSVVLWDVPYD